jgi:hypothetical protein
VPTCAIWLLVGCGEGWDEQTRRGTTEKPKRLRTKFGLPVWITENRRFGTFIHASRSSDINTSCRTAQGKTHQLKKAHPAVLAADGIAINGSLSNFQGTRTQRAIWISKLQPLLHLGWCTCPSNTMPLAARYLGPGMRQFHSRMESAFIPHCGRVTANRKLFA